MKTEPAPLMEIRLDDIVTEGRHRTDLGDIGKLAASLEDPGLIQPIVVTPDNRLVAGERRMAAARSLGWEVIPAVIIHTLPDAISRLKAERAENECRKDFTPSELVSLGRQLEELERPKAHERMREGGRRGAEITNHGVASVDATPSQVRTNPTDTAVADGLGISKSTYQRLKLVDRAQADLNGEVAAVAREQMAKLDAGVTSATSAVTAVREKRQETDPIQEPIEPEVIPHLPTRIHGPRPKHDQILNRVTVGLEGTCLALDDIDELNDTVNAEKALRLTKSLSESIRTLNRINRLLKERTK